MPKAFWIPLNLRPGESEIVDAVFQSEKSIRGLFPEESNLFATMADKINERGQIAGMATVLSGPHKGDIHAFLATPVDARIDKSIADVATTQPKLPANVGKQLLQRFGRGRFEQ